jgi:restriction endonuclease
VQHNLSHLTELRFQEWSKKHDTEQLRKELTKQFATLWNIFEKHEVLSTNVDVMKKIEEKTKELFTEVGHLQFTEEQQVEQTLRVLQEKTKPKVSKKDEDPFAM